MFIRALVFLVFWIGAGTHLVFEHQDDARGVPFYKIGAGVVGWHHDAVVRERFARQGAGFVDWGVRGFVGNNKFGLADINTKQCF